MLDVALDFFVNLGPHLAVAWQICCNVGEVVRAAMPHLPAPAAIYLAAAVVHSLHARRKHVHDAGADTIDSLLCLAMAAAYSVSY